VALLSPFRQILWRYSKSGLDGSFANPFQILHRAIDNFIMCIIETVFNNSWLQVLPPPQKKRKEKRRKIPVQPNDFLFSKDYIP
jgi:hypothetical protein